MQENKCISVSGKKKKKKATPKQQIQRSKCDVKLTREE